MEGVNLSNIDFTALDRPEVLRYVFHPRQAWRKPAAKDNVGDITIPVEENVIVGARFFGAQKTDPTILFFHGNGEIVDDYEDVGPLYNHAGLNFFAVDYRGYGHSTGIPTITTMMRDCHVIFDFFIHWLRENACTGPRMVMGRSLGSASVLELAANYGNHIDGLIVESGFAYAGPLLQLLGIDVAALGLREEVGFRNIDKIRSFDKPTLIIHAEHDHIIPLSDGKALYDACLSSEKTLLRIAGADHNDIFMRGASEYMSAIRALADRVRNGNS
jgi:fermentation-respiration switch protein FrsA (DUF1100 family)